MLSLITTMIVQLLKPLVELIPGLTDSKNQVAHDNLLRVLQIAMNFGLLLLAANSLPSAFAGLQWWDMLAIAAGQSVLSHVSYKVVSGGSSGSGPAEPIVDYPPPGVIGSDTSADHIPTVPRG
jgi:hypothetical protein